MTLDAADLALIDIDPAATEREKALVAEVRKLRAQLLDVRRRIQKAAYSVPYEALDALSYVQDGVE